MNISVRRKWFTDQSTCGELSLDGEFECFTLEPLTRTDDQKPRAIPEGTYAVTLRHSVRFHRVMPHVEDVSGFEGILIHHGNFPRDTEGCCLVGRSHTLDFVGSSRVTFDDLFAKLLAADERGEKITITYGKEASGNGSEVDSTNSATPGPAV